MRLERQFYRRDGREVARELLGKVLVRKTKKGIMRGIIVETEAYLGPEDRASHAWGGRRTERTETMYMDGGNAYVYMIYGIYHCLNIVAMTDGVPHAVLIRALEPMEGEDAMAENRGGKRGLSLTNGPGKLAQALEIGRGEDALDLVVSEDMWIEDREFSGSIETDRRIGIEYAEEYREKPWRYYIKDNPWVSRKKSTTVKKV